MNQQNQDSGMIRTYKMEQCYAATMNQVMKLSYSKGKVTITKVIEGREQVLAVLGEGTPVGEMSLLSGDPRGANLVAKGDVQVLAVGKLTSI
jgi:hypothetical protein